MIKVLYYKLLFRKLRISKLQMFVTSIFFVLLLSSSAIAQQKEVSGTVTDAFTDETLIGVNIVVPGTTIGTTTDMSGNYSIALPDTVTQLQFSYVGYETLIIALNDRSVINVEMQASAILGSDLIVTGYSVQRRVDLTGSISVADVDNMQRIAESSVTKQLQGQVSGVSVAQSGQPGDEPAIRIRVAVMFGGFITDIGIEGDVQSRTAFLRSDNDHPV